MTEDKWTQVRVLATAIIQHFEGCHLKSYVLKGETWATIGWGVAIPLAQHPKTITQAEADNLFQQALVRKEAALRKEIPAVVLDKMSVGELAGTLSFRYNLKDVVWLAATCNTRKQLVAGNVAGFKEMHGKWVRGNDGAVLGGLQRRRRVEREVMDGRSLADIKKANWYQGWYQGQY